MLNTGDRHKLVPGTGVGECAWRSCRKLRGEPGGYGEAVDLFDEASLCVLYFHGKYSLKSFLLAAHYLHLLLVQVQVLGKILLHAHQVRELALKHRSIGARALLTGPRRR